MPNWDYRANAGYFVTICTKNRKCFFGNIPPKTMQGNDFLSLMQLSQIGKIAYDFWLEIPIHFPFVKLDEFVVMPNHVHGIVIIEKPDGTEIETGRSVVCNDPTKNGDNSIKNEQMANISPKSGSLSAIIRSYKSAVTKNVRKINSNFAWLPRFHDHIIRNEMEFSRIANYIKNNPRNWNEDKFRSLQSNK